VIATSADLVGDPAVIGRAEAVGPAVAAASNEIENTRRLPPALLDKLHEAGLFRPLLPVRVERHRNRSPHLPPCDRDHRPSRHLDRLVPEPGRWLRDVVGTWTSIPT
jgi:hypothetical protein